MAKKLMKAKSFTVTKALWTLVVNAIITGLTYWQTQNFEMSATVFVGILVVVLPLVVKYAEPEPTPTPAPVTIA